LRFFGVLSDFFRLGKSRPKGGGPCFSDERVDFDPVRPIYGENVHQLQHQGTIECYQILPLSPEGPDDTCLQCRPCIFESLNFDFNTALIIIVHILGCEHCSF
jgi:hypothetical protein